jgi:hypothetical protein
MSLKLLFRAGVFAMLTLALSATLAFAQDHDHGHDRDDDRWHDRDDHDRDHDREHAYEHERREAYHDHDREIRDWYHTHYRHLPPGLAKRDRLSPGQERFIVAQGFVPVELRTRMQPCPHELEVMLPAPPPGHVHVFDVN